MIVYTLKVSESWRIGKPTKVQHPRVAGLVADGPPAVQTEHGDMLANAERFYRAGCWPPRLGFC
jgi:hypothetical protein